jgi:hypothetical protein
LQVERLIDGQTCVVGRHNHQTIIGRILKCGDAQRAGIKWYVDAVIARSHETAELRHNKTATLWRGVVVQQPIGISNAFPPDIGAHVADREAINDLPGRGDRTRDGLAVAQPGELAVGIFNWIARSIPYDLIVLQILCHPDVFIQGTCQWIVRDGSAIKVPADIIHIHRCRGIIKGSIGKRMT